MILRQEGGQKEREEWSGEVLRKSQVKDRNSALRSCLRAEKKRGSGCRRWWGERGGRNGPLRAAVQKVRYRWRTASFRLPPVEKKKEKEPLRRPKKGRKFLPVPRQKNRGGIIPKGLSLRKKEERSEINPSRERRKDKYLIRPRVDTAAPFHPLRNEILAFHLHKKRREEKKTLHVRVGHEKTERRARSLLVLKKGYASLAWTAHEKEEERRKKGGNGDRRAVQP